MDAADRAVGWIATTDFEEQPYGKWSVGLVAQEVIVGAVQIAHKLARPMALVASFLRRTEVFDRGWNWAWIFVE